MFELIVTGLQRRDRLLLKSNSSIKLVKVFNIGNRIKVIILGKVPYFAFGFAVGFGILGTGLSFKQRSIPSFHSGHYHFEHL